MSIKLDTVSTRVTCASAVAHLTEDVAELRADDRCGRARAQQDGVPEVSRAVRHSAHRPVWRGCALRLQLHLCPPAQHIRASRVALFF